MDGGEAGVIEGWVVIEGRVVIGEEGTPERAVPLFAAPCAGRTIVRRPPLLLFPHTFASVGPLVFPFPNPCASVGPLAHSFPHPCASAGPLVFPFPDSSTSVHPLAPSLILAPVAHVSRLSPSPFLFVSFPFAQEALDSPIDRRADYYRYRALDKLRETGKLPPAPLLNLPNCLTLSRIVMVPAFAALWFVPGPGAALAAAGLFGLAALTDWLDGFLARKLGITSPFGAFLDPVADKIMVSTALILLCASPPASLPRWAVAGPVAVMVGREITMSSLREWAAGCGDAARGAVKVNSLGKWKTALQMAGLTALLVLRAPEEAIAHELGGGSAAAAAARAAAARPAEPATAAAVAAALPPWLCTAQLTSHALLCLSAVLAVWSLAFYMSNVWQYFRYPALYDAVRAVQAAPDGDASRGAGKTPAPKPGQGKAGGGVPVGPIPEKRPKAA